ncbi:hypothetical protein [Rossellomorea arthrocnemi]|jgi:hypothetical protein|uniref:hypothetical protein n=1 Tax=Rossellomorea arthrocnemi TaxID=2769542 RepID=UPI00191A4F6E|nr:hypothetical protein [Rossellomorea arthrocnemi]
MERLVLMLLLCITFVTIPFQQQTHPSISTNFDKVATISDHLYITDEPMILDTVPSLVHKQDGIPPNKITIPPEMHSEVTSLMRSSFCFEICPDSLGFLEMVRSYSNYL